MSNSSRFGPGGNATDAGSGTHTSTENGQPDVRQAALDALANGISTCPPKQDGSKSPDALWKVFQERRAFLEEIREWYGTKGTPLRSGLGAVTGPISGNLECFEFDAQGRAYAPFKAAAVAVGLGELVERIEAGYSERTPTGGIHWLYRCDEIAGNTRLAMYDSDEVNEATGKPKRKALIETRGIGGYVVLAPSNGKVHLTGGAYELLRGGFATIARITPEERKAIWNLARTFDELSDDAPPADDETAAEKARRTAKERAERAERKAREQSTGGWEDVVSPLDAYNADADWDDILPIRPAGWAEVYEKGVEKYLRRPGKAIGISATLNRNGSDRLYVFSTSTEFTPEVPYSKSAAYAQRNHGGDFKAATRALSLLGNGTFKAWVWLDDESRWDLQTQQNPCPKGGLVRIAKVGDGPPKWPPRLATAGSKARFAATATATAAAEPSANGPGGNANGPPVDSTEAPRDPLPVVVVTNLLHEVVTQAVAALSHDAEVFQRGTSLVRMVRNAKPPRGMRDTEGTPQILPINVPRLLELLSRCADWQRWDKDKDGKSVLVPHSPSEKFAKMVADRCDWPGIRPLEGIVEAPTLRPDGTILQEKEYDRDTGLYLLPNAKFPRVPEDPTPEDAKAAIDTLLAIVADFPFESDAHRYAWLASCITVVARFAIAGPVPLFLFDANTSGSGKTKLCDVNAVIATGRPMPRSSYSQHNEETAKQLLSIALGGFPFVLFDNLQTGDSLGGSALDKALTSTSLNERLLGTSKMSGDVPFHAVLHATGNNLGLKGDALRRIVPCRLESPMERPEERDDFTIKGDLLAHVRENRPALVVAALVVVRAYVVAKKPPRGLTPMDYPAWSGLIRNAIHWASGVDPCATRKGKIAEDDAANELAALIKGWEALCEAAEKDSLTSAEAIQTIEAARPVDHVELKSILCEWSKDGKLPSTRTIGNRLNKIRGRVSGRGPDARSFHFSMLDGNRRWFVKPATGRPPSGSSDSSDSSHKPTRKWSEEEESPCVPGCGDEKSHLSNLSHLASTWSDPDAPEIDAFGPPPTTPPPPPPPTPPPPGPPSVDDAVVHKAEIIDVMCKDGKIFFVSPHLSNDPERPSKVNVIIDVNDEPIRVNPQ